MRNWSIRNKNVNKKDESKQIQTLWGTQLSEKLHKTKSKGLQIELIPYRSLFKMIHFIKQIQEQKENSFIDKKNIKSSLTSVKNTLNK